MKRILLFTAAISLIVCLNSSFAAADQQFAEMGDLRLENGQIIKDCRIGFRVFGKMDGQKSNVVVFPTWFSGTSEQLGLWAIGGDKFVDTTRYCVIGIDVLGNGISSSPSNSVAQKDGQFPAITIGDMVRSQHRLLTEKFGLSHVHAVIGGSMGGMQTFEWLVQFPDFMDKAIPYVGSPRLTSFDLLFWKIQMLTIETGLRYHCPFDSIIGMLFCYQDLLITSPQRFNQTNPAGDVEKFIHANFAEQSKLFTVYNYACQLQAMINHNIARHLDNSLEKAAAKVKAKVLVIVGSKDMLVTPQAALEFAKMINAQTLVLDNDCGHLAPGCDWTAVSKAAAEFLRK